MARAGFFKAEDKAVFKAPVRVTGCASCGLATGCLHPRMEPTGRGKRGILVVAEAPGQTEDETGTQLIGKVGQRFRRTLEALHIDLDNDCIKTNACRCRPRDSDGNNRPPTNEEVAACRSYVFELIKDFKPTVILALGGSALYSLLQGRWKHDSDYKVQRWRGLTIPDHELNVWLCPTFHPSFVERSDYNAPAVDVIWQRDLKAAIHLAGQTLLKKPIPEVTQLRTPARITQYLHGIYKHSTIIAFDYETTGLKPYGKDHRIVSCSMAEDMDMAYAWLWKDIDAEGLKVYQAIMQSKRIKKIAANIKFEHVWTRQKLGFEIQGWWWDTVTAAHVIDNRRGNGSVAFQSYTRLGVMDFKSDTQYLLKAPDSNSLNQIDKIPVDDLLQRNGLDSAYEWGIAMDQRAQMGFV